jgi:hypothetical protein
LGKKNSYSIPFTELTLEDWDSAIDVICAGRFSAFESSCR